MLQLFASLFSGEDGQAYGYVSIGTILTVVLIVVLLMILL